MTDAQQQPHHSSGMHHTVSLNRICAAQGYGGANVVSHDGESKKNWEEDRSLIFLAGTPIKYKLKVL